ncbi:MAG: DUF5011 domain-containing protein [Nitrosopumilus sp.]|nr:DUF5011 domain-containing protein [Nitrosopumilus sp.]
MAGFGGRGMPRFTICALLGAAAALALAGAGEAEAAFPEEHVDGGLFLHVGDEATSPCAAQLLVNTQPGTSLSLDAEGLDATLVLTSGAMADTVPTNYHLAYFEIKALSSGKVVHVYNFTHTPGDGTYSFYAPAAVLAELSDEDSPEDDIYGVRAIKRTVNLSNLDQDTSRVFLNPDIAFAEFVEFGSNVDSSNLPYWVILNFTGDRVFVKNDGTAAIQSGASATTTVPPACVLFGASTNDDTTPPVVLLNHPYDIYTVRKDSAITDPKATCYDESSGPYEVGALLGLPSTASVVDTRTSASSIGYACVDIAGNASPEIKMNVFVYDGPVDTVRPNVTVITIEGAEDTTINVPEMGTYEELGATCRDHVDGDLPVSQVSYSLATHRFEQGRPNAINSSLPTTWRVAYECSDSAGNIAITDTAAGTVNTRTVNTAGTVDGFLTGPNPLYLRPNGQLPNPLSIECKGGNEPVPNPVIDRVTVGERSYEYECGVSGYTESRRVIVREADPPPEDMHPVIRLKGDAKIDHPEGTTYSEDGASCGDPEDGALEVETLYPIGVSDGDPLPGTAQVYYVHYMCEDSGGNQAFTTRIATQADRQGPTITPSIMNNTLHQWDTALPDISARCEDPSGVMSVDATVSHAIPVDSAGNADTIGNYTITFACEDSLGNPSSIRYRFEVEDLIAPTIDFVTPFTHILNITYAAPVAICNDNFDGDGYDTTDAVGDVDAMMVGDYPVTYSCTDSRGNPQTASGVVMVANDDVPPVITAPATSMVLLDDSLDPALNPTCTDNLPNDPPDSENDIPLHPLPLRPPPAKSFVQEFVHSYLGAIESPRAIFVGQMNATFTCHDNFGNPARAHTSLVSVIGRPVIILNEYVRPDTREEAGTEEVTLEQGELYWEPGALCLHHLGTFENPMAKNATVVGERVKTTELGTYTVTYTCRFDDGATADPVERAVTITEVDEAEQREMMRPVFTLDGEPFFGSMRITQAPGAKFDEERIRCVSPAQGGPELLPLITAAAFIDENPLKVPAARLGDGRPDIAVSGNMGQIEAGALLNVLASTIRYGLPARADVDLGEDGITVSEFLRKAPPGRYVAFYDCNDPANDIAARVSLDILIIQRISDDDWKLTPTFGRTWAGNDQLVRGGFSFNGEAFDVTDNFHVDFVRQTSEIGSANTVTIKVHAPMILETVTLSLGIPDLSRVTDAEAEIAVDVLPDYDADGHYVISAVRHEQDEALIDEDVTSVSMAGATCNADQEVTCQEFTITFAVTAPLVSDVMAISAMDTERRATTTYVNDGVEFTGEPTLPAKTAQFSVKRGNQHPVETVRLVQDDRRYDIWTDQDGFAWLRNSYGSWFQLTHAGFERLQDPEVTVMTRIHDGFGALVEGEREKARAVFDSASIRNTVGESFSFDAPVKTERLTPELLELLRSEEARALQYLGR